MKIDFIKKRKIFYLISSLIIIAGLISFAIRGLNEGIDFTGGSSIQIKVGKKVDLDKTKDLLKDYDKDMSLISVGEKQDEFIIKSNKSFSNKEVTEIVKKIEGQYQVKDLQYESENFEPTMGTEIKKKALISIAIASVAMLIYISIRFEIDFAVASILALLHDVLIALSLYSIFQIPANNAFIAAILTILGYSINDTIVVFDRIREELKLNPKDDLGDIVNTSINKSLTRTINTSFTTLVAIALLYIFGVDQVKILALPLIFGVITEHIHLFV